MGGCASKPKGCDSKERVEAPGKPEAKDVSAQEKASRGGNESDAPLVDVSEPKEVDAEMKTKELAAAEPPKDAAAEPAVPVAEEVEAPIVEKAIEAVSNREEKKSDAPLVTI